MSQQRLAGVRWVWGIFLVITLVTTGLKPVHVATALARDNATELAPEKLAANEVVIFSGGYTGNAFGPRWGERFGTFGGNGTTLLALTGATVISHTENIHAEAQVYGLLGTDFTFSAEMIVAPARDMDLQFRISDEGRYGVQLRTDSIVLYRLARDDIPCDLANTATYSHCPNWPEPSCIDFCDEPQWVPLAQQSLALVGGTRHRVSIQAEGSQIRVALDGATVFGGAVVNELFAVGHFGIYVFGTPASLPQAEFANIQITTDPTRASNLALLYSTAGYEATGTKRALVRTLNDLPPAMIGGGQAQTMASPAASTFMLKRDDGVVVKEGSLEELVAPVPPEAAGSALYVPLIQGRAPQQAIANAVSQLPQRSAAPLAGAKTFGMQLWEADFSSVTEEGTYTLFVYFVTSGGTHTLQSASFEIRNHLVSERMLRPLTILNAQARRAADDDMRRNWERTSNAWSVAVDGAFLADRADAENGALLTRIFDINNWPIYATNFRYVGEITIISGCDAQMQFRITETERWAVTLQAGAAGGCAFGDGPGAVRLHREGSPDVVPGGFEILAADPFPADAPFRVGHAYRVEILAVENSVLVSVDGNLRIVSTDVPPRHGRFAPKAWGSTARFDHVQAWHPDVTFLTRTDTAWDGTLIPTFLNKTDASHQALITCQTFFDAETGEPVRHDPVDPDQYQQACNPYFTQIHGFQDANNNIGEASSHGTFLAGLMKVWTTRAAAFNAADREALRAAIQANVLYIGELYQAGSSRGELAHSEMGRQGVNGNLGPWHTELALYGLSAFAADGVQVDAGLARLACERGIDSVTWLEQNGFFANPAAQSVIYGRIARCATREQLTTCPTACQDAYHAKALAAVDALLTAFATPGVLGRTYRDAGRVIPWFEGTYELLNGYSEKQMEPYAARLNNIATLLVTHLTEEHACNDAEPTGARCAANGFYVLPLAGGENPTTPLTNWVQMDQVPDVQGSSPEKLPYVHFYNAAHFAIAAADAVYLARLSRRDDLERVATGNLYWILGLNPGIPASKVVDFGSRRGPWQATSFVYNLDRPFARTIEGYRTEKSSAKGVRASWEISPASPHHEAWWMDPLDNGFQSIVNGHVLIDGQWDYWNNGLHGWSSGETFILNDGLFVLAALLLEDWLAPGAPAPVNPYDTTLLTFFDTSHIDRVSAGWDFDDPDWSEYAQAARAATDFCNGKGFGGGRFTGHYIGERDGLLCVKANVTFIDATDAEIAATDWDFQDINQTHWAQVARAATGVCNARGFVGGFFTGHQIPGARGLICLGGDAAQWFDAT